MIKEILKAIGKAIQEVSGAFKDFIVFVVPLIATGAGEVAGWAVEEIERCRRPLIVAILLLFGVPLLAIPLISFIPWVWFKNFLLFLLIIILVGMVFFLSRYFARIVSLVGLIFNPAGANRWDIFGRWWKFVEWILKIILGILTWEAAFALYCMIFPVHRAPGMLFVFLTGALILAMGSYAWGFRAQVAKKFTLSFALAIMVMSTLFLFIPNLTRSLQERAAHSEFLLAWRIAPVGEEIERSYVEVYGSLEEKVVEEYSKGGKRVEELIEEKGWTPDVKKEVERFKQEGEEHRKELEALHSFNNEEQKSPAKEQMDKEPNSFSSLMDRAALRSFDRTDWFYWVLFILGGFIVATRIFKLKGFLSFVVLLVLVLAAFRYGGGESKDPNIDPTSGKPWGASLPLYEPEVVHQEDGWTKVVVPPDREGGVLTGVFAGEGKTLEIRASGQVDIGKGPVSPKGETNYGDRTVDSPFIFHVGGLEFWVGQKFRRYFVGVGFKEVIPGESGEVVLRVIESRGGYHDGNTGAFTVYLRTTM